jgi:hypothetical protein
VNAIHNLISKARSIVRSVLAGLPADRARGVRLSVESLEDRIVPADYYWRPQDVLVVNINNIGHWLASNSANWTDDYEGSNVHNNGPGANDKLIIDDESRRVLTINVAHGNNAAASDTFAAIQVTPTATVSVHLQKSVTFSGGNVGGNPQNIASEIRATGVSGVLIGQAFPGATTMTFSGSALTAIDTRFETVGIINASANNASFTGSVEFEGAYFTNRGIAEVSGNDVEFDGNGTETALENRAVFKLSTGTITLLGGARIHNVGTGATFGLDNNVSIINGGDGGNFLNEEYFWKGNTTAAGASTIEVSFTNTGTMEVLAGSVLKLEGTSNRQEYPRLERNAIIPETRVGTGAELRIGAGWFPAGKYVITAGALLGTGEVQGIVSMVPPPREPDAGHPRFIVPGKRCQDPFLLDLLMSF